MCSFLSLLILIGGATAAFAREQHSRDFQQSVPLAAGRSFRIDHSQANINIRAQAKNEGNIHATVRCSADRASEAKNCADQIQLRVDEGGGAVSVRTDYPNHTGWW